MHLMHGIYWSCSDQLMFTDQRRQEDINLSWTHAKVVDFNLRPMSTVCIHDVEFVAMLEPLSLQY